MGTKIVTRLSRTVYRSIWLIVLIGLNFGWWPSALAIETTRDTYLNNQYYNNLVSEADFTDINSMSAEAIQGFLNERGSYLKDFSENGRTAAQIIYDASHGHGEASGSLYGIDVNTTTGTVSPRVILVTLQKEQSLITKTERDDNALNKAMGYGCPDSGGCNSKYAGFTNQVEWGAWQLRYNNEAAGKNASWWETNYSGQIHYYTGKTATWGWAGTYYLVTYGNRATAALYRYTPHVGYGNFNFWKLMIDWFGVSSPTVTVTPETRNDTDAISITTYKTKFKATGSKASNTIAYFNNDPAGRVGETSWTLEFEPPIGRADYYVSYADAGNNTVDRKQITIDRRKVGDINGDVKVDLLDLSVMSEAWGQNVSDDAKTNLNPETDSLVDLLDISLFANAWEG